MTAATRPEVGALREWWRQLAAGQRTIFIDDALLHAAIQEANARDEMSRGQMDAASNSRRAAAELLLAVTAEAAA